MVQVEVNECESEQSGQMSKELKSTNRKYKVYNFVENCQNVNYNIKYEILPHKTIEKMKKRNIIKIQARSLD